MRKALLFNFLLEATIIASIAIVLMLIVRKCFRKQLGNKAIVFAWLLVAIRLLCPLSLQNPAMNEIRSPYAPDKAIRPIAGQVQVRVKDLVSELDRLQYRYDLDRENAMVKTFRSLENSVYSGYFADCALLVYLGGAILVGVWFFYRNIRFRHMLKAGRVEALSGKVETEYRQLCEKRKVRALPVYYTDPLASACLVGVLRPYIALPLTSKPNETIRVLEHELCHYKGWDHIWGVVRLLCCMVHWFNPLVWLAASLSMNDCELACDDRVVRGFSEEERREYAGILVLAAARRNAPGLPVLATGMTMTGKKLKARVQSIIGNHPVVRWFALSFVALALLLLPVAFCTSEYVPVTRFSAGMRSNAEVIDASPVTGTEEAIEAAKRLWQSPYLDGFSQDLHWTAEAGISGYTVRATKGNTELFTVLAPDGTPVMLDYIDGNSYGSREEIDPETVEWEDSAKYLLAFMDSLLPGHSNRVEAFDEGAVFKRQGEVYVYMHALAMSGNGIEKGYTFTVRLGDDPCVISYYMEQPVHALLWEDGLEELASTKANRVCGIVARAYTDADRISGISQPPEDAPTVEQAMEAAIDVLCNKYGEKPELLRRFEVRYKYTDNYTDGFRTPYWQFDFRCTNTYDYYSVVLHSPELEVIYTSGRDEGNG
ncbi:MAG: M56 family metallopeptidase [Clostridiales bacterium]|nr:M56 family metallopeptidase [Clostridiales bacterium]